MLQHIVDSAVQHWNTCVSSTRSDPEPRTDSSFSFFPSLRKKSLPPASPRRLLNPDPGLLQLDPDTPFTGRSRPKCRRSRSTPPSRRKSSCSPTASSRTDDISTEESTSVSAGHASLDASETAATSVSGPSVLPSTYYLENGSSVSFLESMRTQFSSLWKLWQEESLDHKRSTTRVSADLDAWLWSPHETLVGSCGCGRRLPPFVFDDEWVVLRHTLVPTETILRRPCTACYRQDHCLYEHVLQTMTPEHGTSRINRGDATPIYLQRHGSVALPSLTISS